MSGILEALMKGGQTMLSGAENLGSDALSGLGQMGTGLENLGSSALGGMEQLGQNFLQNTGLQQRPPGPGMLGSRQAGPVDPQAVQRMRQMQMQQMMRKIMLSQMLGQLGGGQQQGGIGSQLPMLLMMLNQGGGYGTP